MAKQSSFDLGDVLAGVLPVSESDTREQITYLDLTLLDEDTKNFYSVDGLDELAANIELIGLQQPLRVRANPDAPGRYVLVSGHRRRRAIRKLYDENPERWGTVPCIIEQSAGSAALQELRLIYANADTRKMSSADLSAQVERVERLLYQLKEEGYDFPGRMRDHVAQACKVSATKLATLKVIRENLIDTWKGCWKRKELSESAAYALAQLNPARQADIYAVTVAASEKEAHGVYESTVTQRDRDLSKIYAIRCKKTAGGGPCTNTGKMKEKLAKLSSWQATPCTQCCELCRDLISCSYACPKLASKQKQLKADEREAQKQAKAAREAADAPKIERVREVWRRWDTARRAAKKSMDKAFKAGDEYYSKTDDEKVAKIIDGTGKVSPGDYTPYSWTSITSLNAIVQCAELFGCSTDYLLGRTDVLTPEPEGSETASDEASDVILPPRVGCWHSGVSDLPINRHLLTWHLTNDGDVYRAAIWDGKRFVDTKAKHKELSGIQVARWMEIPPDNFSVQPTVQDVQLQFKNGTPDHECVCWCAFSFGEERIGCQAARWKNGAWLFYSINETIDAECVGWIELPDYEGVLRK